MSAGGFVYRGVDEMPEGVPFEMFSVAARKKITVTRFKSDGKANNYGRYGVALVGDYARAWLSDPCGQAVDESLHAHRLNETKQHHEDRMARRKAKDVMAREAMTAKTRPARRRDW